VEKQLNSCEFKKKSDWIFTLYALSCVNCSLYCVVGGSVAVVSAAGSSAVTGSVGLAGRVPSSIAAASADTVRQSNSVSYTV